MATPTTNDVLKPGEIRFVDNYIPSLKAGDYTITVEQNLEGSGAYSVKQSFPESQEFKVRGPRFRIDPADIHQLYPPPNSQGEFQHDLPHIVLTKRALPWERSLFNDDSDDARDVPWIALLLFDPSEILPPVVGKPAENQSANPHGLATITAKEFLAPEKGVLTGLNGQDALDDSDEELACHVIDITPDTFKAVMPNLKELKYLAHCREVALDQKVVPGPELPGSQLPPGNAAGWYSVVVGGRFPSPPAPGQAGQRNVAHLVSLEGFKNYIDDPDDPVSKTFPSDISRVRLLSLASWSFTCLAEKGESFSALMLGLINGADKADLKFKLSQLSGGKVTEAPGNSGTEEKDYALKVLEAGYIPCSYHTRQGEDTLAWYRGPFTPDLVPRLPPGCQPFSSAAQAMIYDKKHGLFDLSYAVAWEIGRMLAISDQRFGMLLLNRRRRVHHLIDQLQERDRHSSQQILPDPDNAIQGLQALLEGNLDSNSFNNDQLGTFAMEIGPLFFKPEERLPPRDGPDKLSPSNARPASPELADIYTLLAKYHQDHDVQKFLKEIDNEGLDRICEWLARLYLLYGVPFNNLVPDERLLPPETIRFFYLDRNWLEVLLDGALSIGMHSSRDVWYQKLVYEVITNAVHEQMRAMRSSLLGKVDREEAGNAGEGQLAGLLIRSAVVSGWPGMEVRAYRHCNGKRMEIGLLRMDRPAADMLLCIFNQVPDWIEFDEPKEGLHFGVEVIGDKFQIDLREQNNIDVGKLTGDHVEPEWDLHRKLKIQNLLDAIKKKLGAVGPADFALQMVKVPQQMVFKTASKT